MTAGSKQIVACQDTLIESLTGKHEELGLTPEKLDNLIASLFDDTYDTVAEDPGTRTTQRARRTAGKAIASLVAGVGSGDSDFHQDWASRGTFIVALSFSPQTCGTIGLKKLNVAYLCRGARKMHDRERRFEFIEESLYPCGGSEGTAMTLTCRENEGYLHGTHLRLTADQIRIMIQITGRVKFGKADAVMAIWRREVFGEAVETVAA